MAQATKRSRIFLENEEILLRASGSILYSYLEIRRLALHTQPRQILFKTLSGKYPIQNSDGRVYQVLECLCSKCEALSSNPSKEQKEISRFILLGTQ
jgi:hypothetical protein